MWTECEHENGSLQLLTRVTDDDDDDDDDDYGSHVSAFLQESWLT